MLDIVRWYILIKFIDIEFHEYSEIGSCSRDL